MALQPGEIEIFDNIGGLYTILILILLFCGLGLMMMTEDEKLLEKDNSNIACRVCNKSIESKSTIERNKGTAGIEAEHIGMIVGTIILPDLER